MTGSQPLLTLQGVCKSFPGVRALADVDLTVGGGEVVSLVGQNGAGKSTLMSIVGGIYAPDEGSIRIAGEEVSIGSPAAAEELGIGLVHQEPTLVPNLTVAANLFLNRELTRGGVVLDFKRMKAECNRITRTLGFDIEPDRLVEDLSLVEKEALEIAKAMLSKPRILILDEVTAPLNADAVERLFEIVAALKAEGIAIIFISHRLGEVIRVSDRIVVLRDGRNAGDLGNGASERDVISLMLGERDGASLVPEERVPEATSRGDVCLSVECLSKAPYFHEISFTLAHGEILGFAGLKGSGISELLKTLYGAYRKDTGTVLIGGREVAIRRPTDAIRSGVGMLTNDRQKEGLALGRGVEENITISSLDRLTNRLSVFRPGALGERAAGLTKALSIRTPSLSQDVLNLSGGNQQKVVFAKWLLRNLDVVIADEPTRGVDVGAKEEIYALLLELKREGKTTIVHSPEVPELLAICDRIVVVDGGRIVGEIDRGSARFNERDVLRVMHAAPEPAAVP